MFSPPPWGDTAPRSPKTPKQEKQTCDAITKHANTSTCRRPGAETTGGRPFPSVGDLFQSFFLPSFLGSNTGAAMPSLDLMETSDDYKVEVDVPGYTMDQINVQFAGQRPDV